MQAICFNGDDTRLFNGGGRCMAMYHGACTANDKNRYLALCWLFHCVCTLPVLNYSLALYCYPCNSKLKFDLSIWTLAGSESFTIACFEPHPQVLLSYRVSSVEGNSLSHTSVVSHSYTFTKYYCCLATIMKYYAILTIVLRSIVVLLL